MNTPRSQTLGKSINAAAQNAAQTGILSAVNLGSSKNYGRFGGRASEQETRQMHQWLPQSRIMFDSDAVENVARARSWVAPTFNGDTGTYDYTGFSLYDNLKKIRYDIQNILHAADLTGAAPVTVESVSNADGTLTISPTQGLTVASLNLANPNTWSAAQTFSAGVSGTTGTFSGAVTGSTGTYSGAVTAASLKTSGFLYLFDTLTGLSASASGTVKMQPNNTLQSSDFVSGLSGWRATDTGDFEIHNLNSRGSITSSVLHYNQAQAFAGSLFVAKSAGKLKSAVSITHVGNGQPLGLLLSLTSAGSAATDLVAGSPYGLAAAITHSGLGETYFIDIEDPEGTTHANSGLFAYNDVLRLKDGSNDTWLLVKVVLDMTTFWRYQCTYKSGTTSATYPKGHGVIDYGTSSGTQVGLLYMTADDADAPFYSIRTHTGNPDTTLTEVGRFGMMRNAFGVTGAYFGFGVGDYAGGNYLKYDTNDGFVIQAGGNNVLMDANGIALSEGTTNPNRVRWTRTGSTIARISGFYAGSLESFGLFNQPLNATDASLVFLSSFNSASTQSASLDLNTKASAGGSYAAVWGAGFVGLSVGASTQPGNMLEVTGAIATTFGDVKIGISAAGYGIYVKEGSNATMGKATLVAGVVVVSTTKVTASSRIFLTGQNAGGTIGAVYVSARTAATSFTITSTNLLDTQDVAWIIFEPA